MNNSLSSASLRFNTFASLSSIEKFHSHMKPQDLATLIVSAATLSLCTTSTLMDVDHRRIGRRIMGHPSNKLISGPLTRDLINTAKGADQ
jgi:hypothetical protein